jgi:hypothetical protein
MRASVPSALRGVQVFQVDQILPTPRGPLHRSQVERSEICLTGSSERFRLESRKFVAVLSALDPRPRAHPARAESSDARTQGGPRSSATWTDRGQSSAPIRRRQMGAGAGADVLGPAHHAPGVQRQAADQDELRSGLRQAPQQLVEGRLAQALRAAPLNRSSLWLRAIPSARLMLSGRRASSRRRRTRTASLAAAREASLSLSLTAQILPPALQPNLCWGTT